MVKKKSPIIPLTFVAVIAAVAFAVNTRMHPVDPKEAAQQQQAPPADPKAPVKVDQASEIQMAMKKASQQSGIPGKPKLGTPANPEATSSIMVGRKQEEYRPKPNATSTDSQWYTKP